MNTSASNVLKVSGLTVGYMQAGRLNIVVSNVDLALRTGEILGLAGESGCGKSTCALAMIGYTPPGSRVTNGHSVLHPETNLLAIPPQRRRALWGSQIAYVAQNAAAALNPALTIGRQLEEPLVTHLGLHGERLDERKRDLLASVALPDVEGALRRYPHQFSGGQQQRIALALALSCRPKVLILDEPTTGLDVTTQAEISELLRSLVDDTRVAALFVSHNLSLLATLADRIAVMYAGEIVENGSAEAVCTDPRQPYTRALLAAVPTVRQHKQVVGIPGSPPSHANPDACAFAPRCAHAADVCVSSHPGLTTVGPDRVVRCARVNELGDARRTASPREPSLERPPLRSLAQQLLLDVNDLRCEYRVRKQRNVVVDGFSLAIEEGEAIGIVGESGSGKSTLLKAIVGIHPPTAGSIKFRSRELEPRAARRPGAVRGEIQLIFQNPDSSLNPRQTIGQIVRRPLRLFRDDVRRSDEGRVLGELLDQVQLSQRLLGRYPHELSGGQKQRVAIARAFAARPGLLLCDEITSALDVSVQAVILRLIVDLAPEYGAAVVLVSHDLAVVRQIARRVVVMHDGRTCEEGAIEQVFDAPQHSYTARLLSAIPELPSREERGIRVGEARE